jgi:hypothetical protein
LSHADANTGRTKLSTANRAKFVAGVTGQKLVQSRDRFAAAVADEIEVARQGSLWPAQTNH